MDVVDVLLRFGARIDDTDDDGRTACHVVPSRRNADMLALLLTHQAQSRAQVQEWTHTA
jgi:ankyrin repeat protein